VVDDLPDNVEILRARLESRGYAVATASNGEEALAAVQADPPQLILCDVMMPGIDGYEVARRIKRDESLPFIPIILVTALSETTATITFGAGSSFFGRTGWARAISTFSGTAALSLKRATSSL
jgi:CheY-like chemotaxis protein